MFAITIKRNEIFIKLTQFEFSTDNSLIITEVNYIEVIEKKSEVTLTLLTPKDCME